ncbi:MAG: rhodanese-like domain-containing protein [Candidatus Coprenecus sp.]
MKRRNFAALGLSLLLAFALAGCASREETTSYQQITAEEAKSMMEEQPDAVILDVREQDEYDAGHIPGAVLLPVGTINKKTAASAIPEKDTVVLVYCRSGNRSKTASQALADLGYTQIYEFGGIKDWPYEVER